MRIKRVRMHATEEVWGYGFKCPGCGDEHRILVKPHEHGWEWNGSVDLPTFSPSILVRYISNDPSEPNETCHSYVIDGRIQFLADCTHALAGKTVDLFEVPS